MLLCVCVGFEKGAYTNGRTVHDRGVREMCSPEDVQKASPNAGARHVLTLGRCLVASTGPSLAHKASTPHASG